MERIILSFCSLIQDERDLLWGSSHSWELKHYSQNISPENWTQEAQTQERGHSEWMAQCLGRNWREEKVLKMRVMSLRLLISLEDIRWRLTKFTDQDWAQTQHGKSKNIQIKRLFPGVVVPFISLLILAKPQLFSLKTSHYKTSRSSPRYYIISIMSKANIITLLLLALVLTRSAVIITSQKVFNASEVVDIDGLFSQNSSQQSGSTKGVAYKVVPVPTLSTANATKNTAQNSTVKGATAEAVPVPPADPVAGASQNKSSGVGSSSGAKNEPPKVQLNQLYVLDSGVQNVTKSEIDKEIITEPVRLLISKSFTINFSDPKRRQAYGNYIYDRFVELPTGFSNKVQTALGITNFDGLKINTFYNKELGLLEGFKVTAEEILKNGSRLIQIRLIIHQSIEWESVDIGCLIGGEDILLAGSLSKVIDDWQGLNSEMDTRVFRSKITHQNTPWLSNRQGYKLVATITGATVNAPTSQDSIILEIPEQLARITYHTILPSQSGSGYDLEVEFLASKHLIALYISYLVVPSRDSRLSSTQSILVEPYDAAAVNATHSYAGIISVKESNNSVNEIQINVI